MKAAKLDHFFHHRLRRIILFFWALILLYLVSYLMDPYSTYWHGYFQRPVWEIVLEWGLSLLFCIGVSMMGVMIGTRLDKYIKWTEQPSRRVAIELALNILSVCILHLIMNLSFTLLCVVEDDGSTFWKDISAEEYRDFIQWIVACTVIAFMIIGVQIGDHLLVNWRTEIMRVSESNQIAMEAELQALKLQIDPHFVFNNLSALSELILEDQQLGYGYAENFSKIYRYLLLNSKKNTITLEEELKFLDSYIFLIKHRVGEGVRFEIWVDEEVKSYHLPPFSLQLIVENALKHNKTLKSNPLQIVIYSKENTELVVENTLLPLEKSEDSLGMGLENIKRRYYLLSSVEPQIVQDDRTYQVTLPLLKL